MPWMILSKQKNLHLFSLQYDCPSVTPFSLWSHHHIIMKFSGVITNDQGEVHTKGQGQRSKFKVTGVKTQLNCFRTVTPVWIYKWWWNGAQSLMLLRRGALLFLAATKQLNTLRPRQNGRHFADDTFKRIFLNEDIRILIEISLKFVPKGPINNIPALVQIMAWRRPGDKPLSEPIMVRLPTHICVTRPQWVNEWYFLSVCPSVCPSVTPFWLCSHYRIMKFSGVITRDWGKAHAKGQGQRSRSQRSRPNFTVSGL